MSEKATVLIVEDNQATAELFAEVLSDSGITATAMGTGAKAIAWLSENTPDLVLLDYSLPDMEGLHLISRVKMPPFIVITGHGDEHIAVDMMKLGAADYLIKTSSLIDELPIIVNRTLHQISVQRELKEAQRQAKSAIERFELAMKTARDGIWDWNLETGETYYSPAYEQMLGFPQEKFARTPEEFLAYIHQEDRDIVRERIQVLISGPADQYLAEFRIRDVDGAWHWILSRATCVKRDHAGSALRIIGTHIDITENKKSEKFLHLATKKVHVLNNRAGTDLMNQLFIVRGYLSLLPEEIQTTESIQKIFNLLEGIESRISFVRSYETLGIAPPRWVNVYLQVVMALSHQPYLSCESSFEHLEILADPLVEQMFNSLVQTSFAYAGSTLSTIQLSMEEEERSLIIVYEDDGDGIATVDKESIFEFGYGEHQSASLFLAREILDITGIQIQETGLLHSGCRFELKVPPGCYRIHKQMIEDIPPKQESQDKGLVK